MTTIDIIGGLPGGSVSAVAMSAGADDTVFIGTKVGIYRSAQLCAGELRTWERLANAPLGILSLVVSPRFEADRRVIAGTSNGIYLSNNAGASWHAAQVPIVGAMVLTLCYSPNYANDGVLLAGTLEDGIWYSEDRGERWHGRNFGLLDAAVFALAFSPNFAADETAFAGTDSAIYTSYNGTRAWKPLNFPESAAPILSLAISLEFGADGVVFAGTERHGLYRSTNGGTHWQQMNLTATSISSLASSPKHGLLAATETGVWQSQDRGETWTRLMKCPEAISLAVTNDGVIVGTIDEGGWMMAHEPDACALLTPPIRSVAGMALSLTFERDRTAFMYGLQEGIWRTLDGGITWAQINDTLPSLNIHALILSPAFVVDQTLVAASAEGILGSRDAGDHWDILTQQPAHVLAVSPSGQWLAAAGDGSGLQISGDGGRTWRNVVGPWEAGGRIVTLAVTDSQTLIVAMIEGVDNRLGLWQHTADQCVNVLHRAVPNNLVVSLWVPDEQIWCASFSNQIWTFNMQSGTASAQSSVFAGSTQEENIIAVVGQQHGDAHALYACTGRHLYTSMDGVSWKAVHTFERDQAIAFALSTPKSNTAPPQAYALLLGGSFGKL